MSGRPKTTGRFDTRRELLERIRYLWEDTSCNQSTIARNCRVSAPTVSLIIDRTEWKKSDDWRWKDHNDMELDREPPIDDGMYLGEPFEVDVNLDSRSLTACGSGYDFPLFPLHIPDRIKRDLDLI